MRIRANHLDALSRPERFKSVFLLPSRPIESTENLGEIWPNDADSSGGEHAPNCASILFFRLEVPRLVPHDNFEKPIHPLRTE